MSVSLGGVRLRQRVRQSFCMSSFNPAVFASYSQRGVVTDIVFRYQTAHGSYGGLYSDEAAQGRMFTVVQVPTASAPHKNTNRFLL